MSYLTVISLARAKNYLRIDLDLTDDDVEITSMINAACRYTERITNHIFYAQQKTYTSLGEVKVYDFPINSITTSPAPTFINYSMFTLYEDVLTVELNVGYAVGLVPDELIQACLQMIKVWYYESEKQVNSTLIPESVKEAMHVYKRFL